MKRALRRSSWGLVGLAVLLLLAGSLAAFVDSRPKKVGTVWLEGPGKSRIRGETWVTSSMWDESVSHRYIEVAANAAETPIGEGPVDLERARARLYQHGDQAELVVMDHIYRRDRDGEWTVFRAVDEEFVYRHYASGPDSASGISCWIDELDPNGHQLISACNFPVDVRLVFRRSSYDEPWVLDPPATFAETPLP